MKQSRLAAKALPVQRRRRGVALLIVLASLALLTLVIVAFLINVGTELRSSKTYANGSSVKLLAQSAVNIVEAEITDATKGVDSSGNPAAWASEPGMIRTYNNAGAPLNYYKLYSDPVMVGSGVFANSGTLVPTTWASYRGIYVDLNEPVYVATSGVNTPHYPIIDGDPSHYTATATTTSSSTAPTIGQTSNTGTPQIAGFWVNSATAPPATVTQEAPMPVQWLYVLQDGTVITPVYPGTPGTVTFTGTQPTTANPIVARMAFWTDDESCKVNVNTASESAQPGAVKYSNRNNPPQVPNPSAEAQSFIDTPRVATAVDEAMAIYPAAQNEFQRYPGHPATVSLSNVFRNWVLNDVNYPEDIYPLTPRVNNGGSMEGQIQYSTQAASGTTPALPLRSDRLYATPDEFLFQANSASGTRTLNSASNSSSNNLSTAGSGMAGPTFTATTLDEAKFFLTASSRAPDVNMFNLPRVCMWPLSSAPNAGTTPISNFWTPYDNLIAFCETIGTSNSNGSPMAPGNNPNSNFVYYFQRGDSATTSNTGWLSQTELTDTPRNTTLFNYLDQLYQQPIPGCSAGGSFATKYATASPNGTGKEYEQILMEIFDYIRCVNLHDSSQSTAFHYFSNWTLANATTNSTGSLTKDDGLVIPTIDTTRGLKGFGRFPTVSNCGLIFMLAGNSANAPAPPIDAASAGANTTTLPTGSATIAAAPIVSPNTNRVQASLVCSLFDPSQGFYSEWANVILKVTGTLTWNGAPMSFGQPEPTGTFTATGQSTRNTSVLSTGNTNSFYLRYGFPNNGANFPPWGGEMGLGNLLVDYGQVVGNYPEYPLATTLPITLAPSGSTTPTGTYGSTSCDCGSTINFGGGTVGVSVYLCDGNNSNAVTQADAVETTPIQTITFRFPAASIPAPTAYSASGTITYNSTGTIALNSANETFTGTVTTSSTSVPTNAHYGRYCAFGPQFPWYIVPGDSVQAIVSNSGDLRLAAALSNVDSANSVQYTQHALYGSSAMAHCFMDPNGLVYNGATRGQLVSGITKYWVAGYNATGSMPVTGTFSGSSTPTAAQNGTLPGGYTAGGYSCEPEGFAASGTGGPSGAGGVTAGTSSVAGDWDNGFGDVRDGPYINKADEGDVGNTPQNGTSFVTGTFSPAYFGTAFNVAGSTRGLTAAGSAYFSPARQMPSAGMLGSLPTGVFDNAAWQTLLFHPDYSGSFTNGEWVNGQHKGDQTGYPPDYLMLDFFHMPVVEPYAISEPLSTAGRINMNYYIVPFNYINRDTGVRAVLQSQEMLAVPVSAANPSGSTNGTSGNNGVSNYNTVQQYAYKQCLGQLSTPNYITAANTAGSSYRKTIDPTQTLMAFMAKFNSNDIFRSPAEICSVDLIPQGSTYSSSGATPWTNYPLTGDNSRERPYANIYPLLTTKSNVFTVHYRVQTLKQTSASIAGQEWREGTDVITAEYRGSQTIERYVDPSTITEDYASDVASKGLSGVTTPLSSLYKFRVVSSTQFAP